MTLMIVLWPVFITINPNSKIMKGINGRQNIIKHRIGSSNEFDQFYIFIVSQLIKSRTANTVNNHPIVRSMYAIIQHVCLERRFYLRSAMFVASSYSIICI